MDKKLRIIYASSWAATIAVVFVAVITILAEFQAPLKDWLKSVTGHHWTTKSWLTIGVYAILLFLIYTFRREPTDMQVRGGLRRLFIIAIIGALALFIFFAGHYLIV